MDIELKESKRREDDLETIDSSVHDDDLILSKMGYKPTLHRGLNSVMNFAFGFVEVAVLPSICVGLKVFPDRNIDI